MRRAWTNGAAAVGLLFLAACQPEARAEQADGGEAAVPVRVRSAEAVVRQARVRSSGIVQARTTVDVAFQVGGRVVAVGPDEGDEVRAGAPLARLDATEYALAARQADAAAARAAEEQARYRPLAAAGTVPANDFERMQSVAVQTGAGAGLARKHLADTRLTAPITGIVARRAVEPGATVAPGAPVFTIVDLDPVRVRIGVPEAEVASVRPGQAAAVTVPALAGRTFAGRVRLVGVAADPATRTYTVDVDVPNPDRALRAGMVAEAAVDAAGSRRAVMVPLTAVVRDENDATLLYVVDGQTGRARAVRVEVGEVEGEEVEVVRGLAGGERVIVAGQQRLRDGARVRVTADAGGVR